MSPNLRALRPFCFARSVWSVPSSIRLLVALFVSVALGLLACGTDETPAVSAPGVEIIRPIVLTAEARIVETSPAFERVEVFAERLIFHFKSTPPADVDVGTVVAGSEGGGYLRRLSAITARTDTTIDASTRAAQLTELVADGAFNVRTRRSGDTKWASASPQSLRLTADTKAQVFTPRVLGGLQCGGASTDSFAFTPILDFDLDTDVELDIRRNASGLPRLEHALFTINGSVDVGATSKVNAAIAAMCQFDFIEAIRTTANNKELFKYSFPPIRFLAGAVPIIITHQIEPVFQTSITLQNTTEGFETRSVATYSVKTGAEFKNGSWQGIWEPGKTGEVKMTPTGEGGDVSLVYNITGGIEYKALIYDVAGPKASLEGALEGKLTGNAATCTWSVGAEAGLNAVVGAEINVPVFDFTLADYTASFSLAKASLASLNGRFGSCAMPTNPDRLKACDPCDPNFNQAAMTAVLGEEPLAPSPGAFSRRRVIPVPAAGEVIAYTETKIEFIEWLVQPRDPTRAARMKIRKTETVCFTDGECRDTPQVIESADTAIIQLFTVGNSSCHFADNSCQITRTDGSIYRVTRQGVVEESECVGCGTPCWNTNRSRFTCEPPANGTCRPRADKRTCN
jgi:hypothetical protein